MYNADSVVYYINMLLKDYKSPEFLGFLTHAQTVGTRLSFLAPPFEPGFEARSNLASFKFKCTLTHTQALYHAGMFLWLSGRHDKAREYLERMLKMAASSEEGLALRGWIDLTSGRESLAKRSIKYFEEALAG